MQVCYRSCRCKGETVYEQAEVCFCCEEMEHHWSVLIGFGICGHPRTASREVNIFSLHPQMTGALVLGITQIRYCPWCGEEVEIVCVT